MNFSESSAEKRGKKNQFVSHTNIGNFNTSKRFGFERIRLCCKPFSRSPPHQLQR